MKYEVSSDGKLIGFSDLSVGDPPMGVVLGRFVPNENYNQVRDLIRELQQIHEHKTYDPLTANRIEEISKILKLQVKTNTGEVLEPTAGVVITDYSQELGSEAIEITLLGLPHQTYEKYFSHLIQEYNDRFS